jgi:hypothetical protein
MVTDGRVPVLVLTGPVGVGKTSVGAAIAAQLAAAESPYAFVDADALRRYGPTPPDDPFGERVGLRNLGAVWATFREAGTERLVLADVVESGEKVDAYRAAVPGAEIVVVRLRATPATLERRLRRRESGDDLAWHLRRAPELDRIMDRAGIGDLEVRTDGRPVGEIAAEVLRRTGWPGGPPDPAAAGEDARRDRSSSATAPAPAAATGSPKTRGSEPSSGA